MGPGTAHRHQHLCGWAHLCQLPSAQLTSRKRGFTGGFWNGSCKRALEQLWDAASIACERKKCPAGPDLWSIQPRRAPLTTKIEHALLGEPTNLAVLPSTHPAAGDAGGCAPPPPSAPVRVPLRGCCPWICQTHFRTSAASAARRWAAGFSSSLPARGRGALQCASGVFSVEDVWEWDLLGSLTSNDQQFRMKLLSLCSGLHEKTPRKVLVRLYWKWSDKIQIIPTSCCSWGLINVYKITLGPEI